MDTAHEPAICVHRRRGPVMKFIEYRSGLYYHDVAAPPDSTNSTSNNVTAYSFVTTVASNKQLFSRHEIAGADNASLADPHRNIMSTPSQTT